VGWTAAARCVDHIVPHKGNLSLLWDKGNLQGCCYWHHSVVKQRLELEYQQGTASIHDLKLDSDRAMALTKKLEQSRF
jgi:5-methylcytosine-specific restriction protein A